MVSLFVWVVVVCWVRYGVCMGSSVYLAGFADGLAGLEEANPYHNPESVEYVEWGSGYRDGIDERMSIIVRQFTRE